MKNQTMESQSKTCLKFIALLNYMNNKQDLIHFVQQIIDSLLEVLECAQFNKNENC